MCKKQIPKIIYLVIFILMMVVPGVGTFLMEQETVGNEQPVDFSDINYVNASDKIDSYMSMKFGFRNQMVNIYNQFHYSLFSESKQNLVIAGKDGWLFYSEALKDYNGENVLNEYEISKIAKILSITERSVNLMGAQFVFVSAPNKMEIYSEYMPYYLLENTEAGNYEKLFMALREYNVTNVDLKKVLKEKADDSKVPIYHKLDSHWNNMGAAIAYESIMKSTGFDYIEFSILNYTIKPEDNIDLHKMLFPQKDIMDEDVFFDREMEYYPISNFRGADDLIIETVNESRENSVLVYRDSFGNSMYKFFAENFGEAMFMRAVPYNLSNAKDKDLVVIEIVERNIGNLLNNPPVTEALLTTVKVDGIVDSTPNMTVTKQNGMFFINAQYEDIQEDCVDVYFEIDGKIYEAYPVSPEGDACLYLSSEPKDSDAKVIFEKNGELLASNTTEIMSK